MDKKLQKAIKIIREAVTDLPCHPDDDQTVRLAIENVELEQLLRTVIPAYLNLISEADLHYVVSDRFYLLRDELFGSKYDEKNATPQTKTTSEGSGCDN